MCGEWLLVEVERGRHGSYELEVARSPQFDFANAIGGAKVRKLFHQLLIITVPRDQLIAPWLTSRPRFS